MSAITISAVGDVMLGGLLSSDIERYKDVFLAGDLRKYINADIVFCNLEAPLCNLEGPPKRFKTLIHAKEESIIYLKNAGFNVVSLANNHTTDFGWSSLKRTMELLDEKNINHVGAGKDLDEARKPVVLKLRGLKIAFLAYCWALPTIEEMPVAATKYSPGMAPYDLNLISEDIRKLRNDVDYIIISLHWQDEFTHYPKPKVIAEARNVIDMGADVIIGHHPHVLQGYEEYHNGVIFYSLSNFLFSPWFVTNEGRWINYDGEGEIRRWYPKCREGVILKCSLPQSKKHISYELIPTIQEKIEPIVKLAPEKAKNKIMNKMQEWSLAYRDKNYNENYEKMKKKEDRFKFTKEVKNMIDTYGLHYTLKRGRNRFLMSKR